MPAISRAKARPRHSRQFLLASDLDQQWLPATAGRGQANHLAVPSNKPFSYNNVLPDSGLCYGFRFTLSAGPPFGGYTIGRDRAVHTITGDDFGPPSNFLFIGDTVFNTLNIWNRCQGWYFVAYVYSPPLAGLETVHLRHNGRATFSSRTATWRPWARPTSSATSAR